MVNGIYLHPRLSAAGHDYADEPEIRPRNGRLGGRGTEDAWRLRYKAADGDWIVKEANTASHSGHVISGLTSGVTYTIEVTASCCEGGAARTTTYTPSCAQPGTITLSNKTYNGVTVAWAASGTLDSWNLQYKEAAAEDIPANWTDVVLNTASLSGHTISGLTTDVAYTIRVTAACCTAEPRDIEYTPVCAKPISLTISNRYDVSALAMWSSMSAEGAIGYQYSCVLSGNAPEWSATTSSGTTSKTFTGLATGATYTASVRAVYPGPLYSEAKSVDFNTSAQVPGTITIDELTSEGGTFSWAASAYGAETRYQWKTSAAGSAWSEPLPANVRTVTVTGLNPKTNYTFYVRSYYSETVQSVAASKAFTTECGPESVPWTYDFNSEAYGSGYPECWSILRSDYSSIHDPSFTYSGGIDNSRSFSVYGGSIYGYMYVVLPQFEMPLNNLLLSFYYKHRDSYYLTSSDPQFTVGYFSTPGNTATFVALASGALTREADFTKAEFNLTTLPADVTNIVIRYGGNSDSFSAEAYLDNFSMTLAPGCTKPADPVCTAVTDNTATIEWTDYKPATAWQIEYSVNLDFTSPTVVDANANPFTLTGLSPNTKYYARVKTVCAEDDQSDWSTQHASFRTDCGNSLIRDLPWVFDFESDTETGSGNIPFCWKAIQYDFDAYEGLETYPYVATTGGRSGNFLYFWGGVTESSEQYVTTPGFEENLNTMVLEFYYKGGTDATSPQFTVGYMTDPEDASTFTALKVLDKAGSYTRATIDLKDAPTSVRTISIKFGGGTYPSAGYIDDIRVTTKTNIFTDVANDGLWSTARNWTHGTAPSITDDVSIRKPVTVDDGHATAKSVVLDQSNGNTGQITIQALKGLEVAGTIQVKGDGGLAPATPADLILESSADGNASLVFDNSNATQARVGFYSKGFIADGVKNYQYIGVPFTTANAAYSYYGSWLYSWSVNKNGVLGWVKVPNGGTVEAWTGYCITQEEPTNYVMEGTLVPTTAHDISVPADENMVVGNSWTAPIDISTFDTETDFENLVGNIYFFNTGVDKNGDAGEAETRYAGGTYVTVPVLSAEYKGEDDHINSMQGFFVKSNGAEGVLHLDYDKHVRGTTRGIAGDALHAPRHKTASEEPVVLKVQITGEKYTDRLLLLEREDFTTGFDNGWDGDKWDGNASALYLYTPDSEGTECSVSAVPELEGTVIGFRAGAEDDAYTLSFEYLNSSEPLYLYDMQYKTYTRISTGVTYRFFTGDKDKHERFVIVRKNKEVATGVGEVPGDEVQGTKAKKLLIEDKMYILLNGALYDATGKVVK